MAGARLGRSVGIVGFVLTLCGCTSATSVPPVVPSPTRVVSSGLTAHDSGTREFAAGSAVSAGDGVFRYTTSAGDTFLGIASRFHVCISDLDGGRPLADQGLMLTAGTSITVELGTWPTNADGTVDCVWDH